MSMGGKLRNGIAPALGVMLAAVVLLGLTASPAAAKSTVLSFTNTPSSTQAGGHPNVITSFELGNRFTQSPVPCECNDPRDISIHTPAGVIANPHVISECTAAEFATFSCPADSQAGFVVLRIVSSWAVLPLYRTVPQAGQGGLFVFALPFAPAVAEYLAINARTGGDYGLDFRIAGVIHAVPVSYTATVFWGVPGDPAHDILRFAPGEKALNCGDTNNLATLAKDVLPANCAVIEQPGGNLIERPKEPVPSSIPIAPFTQAPTTCVGPLSSSIDTVAYDHESDHGEAPWPATTGCDKLSFAPSLAAQPTTTQTDSASGLAVDLKVPQPQDPGTPSPSAIRATTVTLPQGFSINPNAADGKLACSDAQVNFGSEGPSACPEFSKVGTTTLDSSALPAPIPGYIYLGEPKPGDRYRIILTAQGFGTNVKIAGSVRTDPATGQILTSFQDLPQAPFQEFDLHFFGSERGLLATPTQCGTYPVKTTFKPWAAELSDQTSTQFFTLDSGPGGRPCPNGPRPFAPSLQAGVTDNTAAAHSPFSLALSRQDGEQNLTGLTVKTPPGFSATLKAIPYCPEAAIASLSVLGYPGLAEQASPACPPASQVGSAVAGAGAGTHPLYVPGKVYLAGPYKGAPLSLLVVLPAVSGPYDLGNVAVRAALNVDQATAQVSAVSDPLPQILDGIPLRTRYIQVNLDRPGFALNPTNCDPFAVNATVAGDEGASSNPAAHFQVANCADLPFAPKLSLSLKGATKRTGHPALTSTLAAKPGEANIKTAQVTLPHSQFLDNAHISAPCTRVQFAAEACPAGSMVGAAKAVSPLLDRPLQGTVYLRSSSNPLPDLVVDLRGQFHVVLVGRVDSVNERIRTSFDLVPDVPVSSFTLSLFGGRRGLLVNSANLCAKPQKAMVKLGGQNGRAANRNTTITTSCAKSSRKGKRR